MSDTTTKPSSIPVDPIQGGTEAADQHADPTGLPSRLQLTPGEKAYFDAIGLTEEVVKIIAVELQYGLGSSSILQRGTAVYEMESSASK